MKNFPRGWGFCPNFWPRGAHYCKILPGGQGFDHVKKCPGGWSRSEMIDTLFGQSKAAYWLRWYKVYVTKVFCIYRKLFGNLSKRTVSLTLSVKNLDIQKWNVYYHGCQGKKLQQKTLFHKEKDWWRRTITDDSLSYLYSMLVFQINSFSMMKEKPGVKDR